MSNSVAERIAGDHLVDHVFAVYGVSAADDPTRSKFIEQHLDELEAASNEVVARAGFVLRRAYEGFGIGYRVPLAIVTIGQSLLGVNLAVAVPAVASNPLAMTCAAVGAVYYGFSALSEDERETMLLHVAEAFSFGVELLKSVIEFCINILRTLLDGKSLAALKTLVTDYASSFGVAIYDITGTIADHVTTLASRAMTEAVSFASSAKDTVDSKVSTLWPSNGKKE